MSLIHKITSRRQEDLINEGLRLSLTNHVAAGTDQVIYTVPDTRNLIIKGIVLTCDSATPRWVTINLKPSAGASIEIFGAYVCSASPVSYMVPYGDEHYGELGYSLTITFSGGGNVGYFISARLSSVATAIGYVEHDGAVGHSAPWFPNEAGKTRGQ